jgi:hypothetical protein
MPFCLEGSLKEEVGRTCGVSIIFNLTFGKKKPDAG